MVSRVFGLGVVVFLGATSLHAQHMPVTAKVRDTSEVMLNGKVTETHVREGVFYRTSTGSELRQWTKKDGKPVTGQMALGSLLDLPHNVNYAVDYQRQEAHVHIAPSVAPPQPSGSGQPHPLGETTVQGLSCTLFPVYLLSAGKQLVLVGRYCRSTQYDLDLRTETTMGSGGPTGETVRQTTELYDIQLGAEPDPKLFDLTKFTIYRPDPKD